MDPNRNLTEALDIAARILLGTPRLGDAARLAELVEALDGWLSCRGALPERWARP